MPTRPKPKRTPLEQFRLERAWSYERLRDEIVNSAESDLRLSISSVSRLCRGLANGKATTQYAIETFLAKQRELRQVAS
jgi:hypothetical protein